jgi:ribosome-binding protein aMBF1 (putative translation factor)
LHSNARNCPEEYPDNEPESKCGRTKLRWMAKSQHHASYRNVPRMLREMREEAGLTQRHLASKVRRSQPWVHKSEIGERRVDISEFLIWCVACDVDPEAAFKRLVNGR